MAQNPNIDDETRARAMKFVEDGASKQKDASSKQRIVSKKELEQSGLSLRDFLNKERGLTRRKSSDPTAGEARDKAAQEDADRIDPGTPNLASGANRSIRSDMSKPVPGGVGKRGGVGDGGQSMVERKNAAMKRAEDSMVPNTEKKMTMEDYYDSGKAKIDKEAGTLKRGGAVKRMAHGGMTSSASKRADGIAVKGHTKGRMV